MENQSSNIIHHKYQSNADQKKPMHIQTEPSHKCNETCHEPFKSCRHSYEAKCKPAIGQTCNVSSMQTDLQHSQQANKMYIQKSQLCCTMSQTCLHLACTRPAEPCSNHESCQHAMKQCNMKTCSRTHHDHGTTKPSNLHHTCSNAHQSIAPHQFI